MNFKTANEFYDFCRRHDACADALQAIAGLTIAEWWDKTDRGDWMMWLADKNVWRFNDQQEAEYERVTAPARRVMATALAERSMATTAEAEYRLVTAPALAEYRRVMATASVQYELAMATELADDNRHLWSPVSALDEYLRVMATEIRRIAGNPFTLNLRGEKADENTATPDR